MDVFFCRTRLRRNERDGTAVTTTYTVIGGVIVHEVRAAVQRNYRPDTLGSTVALTDGNTATDTWTYWPYGEVRTHSGSSTTPFTFVGTLGYCKVPGSDMTYVRARMYMASRGRWATVDPLWPWEQQYDYINSMPSGGTDPSGLRRCSTECDAGGNPCANWVGDQGVPINKGKPVGGWIVCCKGKCYACVNEAIFTPGTYLWNCVNAHEEDHCKRAKCGPGFDLPRCTPDCGTDECLASAVEIDCLLSSAKKCKTEDCRRAIWKRIGIVCDYAAPNCAAANMTFKYESLCNKLK
ncbi:MAG: hypothetical protein JSS66_08565 [Armatimonadetes bacterium]|nr:hypothetical protein [Armatimonadota bacterium]